MATWRRRERRLRLSAVLLAACAWPALTATADQGQARMGIEARLRLGHAGLSEWSPAGTARALDAFAGALGESIALRMPDLEIDALAGLAEVRQLSGESAEAVTLLGRALDRARSLEDSRRLALAAARLASALAALGRPEDADAALMAAGDAAAAGGFALGEARLELARGDVFYWRGELEASLDAYRDALTLFDRLGNVDGAAEARLGLGSAAADLSRDAEARAQLEQARDLAHAAGSRRLEAAALRLLGNVLAKTTEETEAIRCFEAAQALLEAADDRPALAALYNGLGDLHGRLNDLDVAIRYHRKAEAQARAAGLRALEGPALLRIAHYELRLGRLDEASASYTQAQGLFDSAGDATLAAVALAGLGNVAARRGRLDDAAQKLEQALAVVRRSGDLRVTAVVLADLAEVRLGAERASAARDAAAESLRLAAATSDPIKESRAWHLLARCARAERSLDEALRLSQESIRAGESVRARVPGHELRALFFEELDSRYRFRIDLLMELERERPGQEYALVALATAERRRARALLDRFEQASAPIAAADAAGREREQALRDDVRSRALMDDLAPDQADSAGQDRLSERLAELRRVRAAAAPSPAREAGELPVAELRTRLAGGRTLLVEIALGAERSYLWAVGEAGVSAHVLPPASVLEKQARELYRLLTVRQHDLGGSARERADRAATSDSRFREQARALSRSLLGGVEGLARVERLVVVPDGLLSYLPFSALPHPDAPAAEYRPLLLTHEVVRAPSLTAMLELLDRADGRAQQQGIGVRPRIAVFADPVFDVDDPRVAKPRSLEEPGSTPEAAAPIALRGRRGAGSLPRLLASRREAESIARAAPGADVAVATGFDAQRAAAEKALAEANAVVHFATHGVLNDEHPLLSGVVTSLVDANGRRQDGFLRAQDLYELEVRSELVVLSACETALGRLL